MQYMTFGRRTGLRVSEFALGTANFGHAWGGGTERSQAQAIFERFAGAGGTFIDTADCYNYTEAESMVGDFLRADRDHFVVSSKFAYGACEHPRISDTGNSRKSMVRAVEASLRRLGTDYLDLYWVHFADPLTPIDEVMASLDLLVRSGKVLYTGLSNFPAWRVSRGATLADVRGWTPLVGIQLEYSLVERTAEREALPMSEALGLGVAVWSPLGGGLLTGKYRSGTSGRLTEWKRAVQVEDTPQKTKVLDAVLSVAGQVGESPASVAMAWLRHRQAASTTSVIPIVGPRDLAQLDSYLGTLELVLDPVHLAQLDESSTPELGVPHDISAGVLGRVVGGDPGNTVFPAVPVE
ncbi:aldo/keto reductase [Streptomonospora salina]|uniref:Aryl-alcohol dehydrogenase-like predicted oxidoreductase n=1 Tax=Streptomonospora salina TaxID=104205 RepID=A0A841EGR9_9ACTN|nr:aldo/keto reductase [Streptomonospora salina]MBB6000038.1 aryl-alcohol dehydrogenase-like predicted oxidoreductase [Streptomonospora salina]